MSRDINDKRRAKHDVRPSFLQRLASQVNWFVGCRLQHTHGVPQNLEVTMRSRKLLHEHEEIIILLKQSIKADYIAQAKRYKERKKAEANKLHIPL